MHCWLSPFVFIHLGASYDLMERVLDWGILGIGFDLLFGWTGLLSFGQAAFFGTGGFVAAYLLVNNLLSSVWIALAIGTIAAAVAGLLVGWLAVRRIGIYFAMITLAFGQMAFFLENNPLSAFTGGENGLSGVPEPTLGFGGWAQRIHAGLPMYWLLAAFFFASFRACADASSTRRSAWCCVRSRRTRPARPCSVMPCRATSLRCSSSPRHLPDWQADCWACCRASCRPMHSCSTPPANWLCRR